MQKNNRAVIWTVILVVASSILVFVFNLGLFQASQVEQGQLDAVYLVLKQLPNQEASKGDLSAGEAEILNITRQLYEAGVLRDGHKAKAVGFYQFPEHAAPDVQASSPTIYVGLQLKASQFAEVKEKDLSGFIIKEIPPGNYLRTSAPRLNLLSLYVARYISLPALEEACRSQAIPETFRLEVYDKQIRYFVPLPALAQNDTES